MAISPPLFLHSGEKFPFLTLLNKYFARAANIVQAGMCTVSDLKVVHTESTDWGTDPVCRRYLSAGTQEEAPGMLLSWALKDQ